MPLELGMDFGCRLYGSDPLCEKRCLILEAENYRYQAAISDLSGSDIGVHGNDPSELVAVVRSWLRNQIAVNEVSPSEIWRRFNHFRTENRRCLRARGFTNRDIAALSIAELIHCMRSWAAERD